MTSDATFHIVALDRTSDGLCIYFKDGKSGFYSDALLYAQLSQAQDLKAITADDEKQMSGDD